jgi:hypothetical protein
MSLPSSPIRDLIRLVNVANLHALLEPVGNGPLACRRRLGESNGATEGTGSSTVPDTSDADIAGTTNSGVAGHTGGHLNLHVELGAGGERDTLDTETGDVLGDGGGLESRLGGSAGGTIDISGERTRTILVDLRANVSHVLDMARGKQRGTTHLAESHRDSAIISRSRHATAGTRTGSSRNTGLGGALSLGATTAEQTSNSSRATGTTGTTSTSSKKTAEELTATSTTLSVLWDVVLNTSGTGSTLVGRRRRCGTSAHESGDHDISVNGAVALSATKRSALAGRDLAVANDGSVRLGTAAVGRAVAGGAVSDGKTRHGNTVGAVHANNHAVSGGIGCQGGRNGDLLSEVHFEGWVGARILIRKFSRENKGRIY